MKSSKHLIMSALVILAGLAKAVENKSEEPGTWRDDPYLWEELTGPSGSGAFMHEEIERFVREMLEPWGYLKPTMEVLRAEEAWGSLGPGAPAGPPRPADPRPSAVEEIANPGAFADSGDGTRSDPWVGVLSNYLEDRYIEPHDIPAPDFHPSGVWHHSPKKDMIDPDDIRSYMEKIDYPFKRIRVPNGHYRDSGIIVPPGLWLEAPKGATLMPEVASPAGDSLITLGVRSGLVGFELDGRNLDGFEPITELDLDTELSEITRYNAVRAGTGAYVAGNKIRNFTDNAVSAGHRATVLGNRIRMIGFSGISVSSRSLVQDNIVARCGYIRYLINAGDDGIITRRGEQVAILNNLVIGGISERDAKMARHVISGHIGTGTLVAGNIAISDGGTRNTISLTDGFHLNRMTGNLSVAANQHKNTGIQAGLHFNGFGNIIEYNASIMNARAARINEHDGKAHRTLAQRYEVASIGEIRPRVLRNNFAVYLGDNFIHRGSKEEEGLVVGNNTIDRELGQINREVMRGNVGQEIELKIPSLDIESILPFPSEK